MSTGILVGNTMDSPLPTLPKTLTVVILYFKQRDFCMFCKEKRKMHSIHYSQVGSLIWLRYARYTFIQDLVQRVSISPFSVSYTSNSSLINQTTVDELVLNVLNITARYFRLKLSSTTWMSTGIPGDNTIDSSLSTLPKAILVAIMYQIDLLYVSLTKRKDAFILHATYR